MSTFMLDDNIKTSTFPDGQPHIAFPSLSNIDRFKEDWILRCRITNAQDLMNVILAVETLHSHNVAVDLQILYLCGGRMDRRLSEREPYTLKAITQVINSLQVRSVSVFAAHSKTTVDLLNNYDEYTDCFGERSFYDLASIHAVRDMTNATDMTLNADTRQYFRRKPITFVYPDEGASKRYSKMDLLKSWPFANTVTLSKHREERTGVIHGMKIIDGTPSDICIIIDDLCDGGATFKGAAKVLKDNGAKQVALIVAHGIFSKGLPIEGINWIGTTNSYREEQDGVNYVFKFKSPYL